MKSYRILSFIVLFAMALSFMTVSVAAEEEVVYEIFMDENVNGSFATWGVIAESTTEKVKEGTAAVKIPFAANQGWNMNYMMTGGLTIDEDFLANNALQFWYYCDTELPADRLKVMFQIAAVDGAESYIRYSFDYSGADVGTWKLITIPLADWKAERQNQTTWAWETADEYAPDFTKSPYLNFQAGTSGVDPVEPSYLDSIRFIKAPEDTGSTDAGSTDTGSTDTGSTGNTGSSDTGSTDNTGSSDTGSTSTSDPTESATTFDFAVVALAASALSAAAFAVSKKRR